MKILLHICCAPCSIYPIEQLKSENFMIDGIFYNPNIHPLDEFNKRKNTLIDYSSSINLPIFIDNDFRQDEWEQFISADDTRCEMCYIVRLKKTAIFAAQNGYDSFSSTLLVSPYQNHDLIKKIGEECEIEYGVRFEYRDFRSGFRSGQQKARELKLYRQKYCGCIISLNEK